MSEKRDIASLWWFPTNPNERWAGTLTLEPNKSPKLKITVQKNALLELTRVGNPSAPPIIQGCDQNGRPITLLIPGWPRTNGGAALTQIEYSAGYAVLNLELAHRDDFKVNEVSLRMQHLQGWYGVTGFLKQMPHSPDVDLCIGYKMPSGESFSIGEDLSIDFRPGYLMTNGLNEKTLQETLSVTFVSKKGINLSQCREILADFRLLLHFATLEENYPLEIKARKDGHGFTVAEKFHFFDIEIWNSIIKEDAKKNLYNDEWIFKFADLRQNFSEFLSRWIKFADDYEEALSSYCATVYHSLPREIEHLCITQALEAFHGIKFASHEKRNFCDKIEQLVGMYKEHLNGLGNDVPEFAKIVRDNRHYYTHHNPEDLKDGRVVKGAKLIRVNENLKLIFQMCVLTEIGIPAARFSRLRRQLASDIIELN